MHDVYRVGTRVGKREDNPYGRLLDAERMRPLAEVFDDLEVRHHGVVLRYAALGLKVANVAVTPQTGLRLDRIDDHLPLPERMGGSVAVLARR